MFSQEKLKNEWQAFLYVVLNPLAIFLSIITLGLIWFSTRQTNQTLVLVFTVLISILSGVIGSIWAKRRDDVIEERVIVARGKTAIRGLALLYRNIETLERRVLVYIERHNDNELDLEVINTYLEEVLEKCKVLGEEVLSSIENWQDIIPEAEVTTLIRMISEYKLTIGQLEADLESLDNQLEGAKGESEEKVEELQEVIKHKEKALSEAKEELRRLKQSTSGVLTASSLSSPTFLDDIEIHPPSSLKIEGVGVEDIVWGGQRQCSSCGKTYKPKVSSVDLGYCDDCDPSTVSIIGM